MDALGKDLTSGLGELVRKGEDGVSLPSTLQKQRLCFVHCYVTSA